ncbi:a-pheromone processing metallopeptidase ste23 [Stylonychia lemnae]|uniref:A-pheromone processing metallopeptidase ste23 n=1 Tax=Stylonychia lemnae TaxID=5949 RepID=A0A078B2J5_STYLE|nr:a-pheromone processing metallopeptidase ste23 [Stylonychia lemnae]|eukprot:CDW88765.1 a-pheromone processing metallopeptidase ste23 [Stylonychia lemnae]
MEGGRQTQGIQLEKSPKDKNEYDMFTLNNQLQVLLINDNNQIELQKGGQMASVSLSVNAGCLNDPMHRQGLAHFLEHMIFMGSSKYPDESAFSTFISSHGGYSNAYTELEFTNYYFKVDYKGLFVALDMFMWLLKDPLLKQDAQDREIKSIESEFEGNYPYDSSRRCQLLNSNTSDKHHIYNRFTWGNIKSLTEKSPDTLIDDVRKFFNDHYSSDRMKLVIQVKTDDCMNELREKVQEIFSQIDNKNLGLQNFHYKSDGAIVQLPYENNLNQMIVFNSVKNTNNIQILFTFHKQNLQLTTQALYIISQLVGHEGKGSLYQNLKQNEQILSLHSRYDTQQKTLFYTFEVSLTLTEKGVIEYQNVVAGVFRYFKIILEKIESTKDFDEFDFLRQIKQLSEVCFYYYKIPDATDSVCELANEMIFSDDHSQILKDTYSGIIVQKIDLKHIVDFLKQMTLDSCKIVMSGKNLLDKDLYENKLTKTKTEKWFKTNYQIVEKPVSSIINQIQNYDTSKLSLPLTNPLIPEDFKIKSQAKLEKNQIPQLIYKDENLYELWLLQDHTFQMPRAIVQIVFMIPNFFETPFRRAYWSVYTDTLIEKITAEVGYEALMADISYSIKGFENLGFKIKFQGFNDKLSDFIKMFFQIMKSIRDNGFEEFYIRTAVEKSIRSFKNINVEVDQKTTNNRLIYLLQHQYHAKQILEELDKFDLQVFNQNFVRNSILQDIKYMKVFIAGNIESHDAEMISQIPIYELKIKPQQFNLRDLNVTKISLLKDNEIVQWDSIHLSKPVDAQDQDESENESMEDLTGQQQESEDEEEEEESEQVNPIEESEIQSQNQDQSHTEVQSDKNKIDEENKDSLKQAESDEEMDDEEEKEEKRENNSCIQVYFQSKSHDQFTGLALQLIESILEELFYDEMRNKEQLGYYVAVSRRQARGVFALLFTIESAEYDPLHLQEKIEKFIKEVISKIQEKEEIYREYYEGLIARKKEGYKDIKEEAGYYFGQMREFTCEMRSLCWDRIDQEIQMLETQMTKEKLIEVFNDTLLNSPRIAIFRVFAEKYKHLAKHHEFEEMVLSGDYISGSLGQSIDMFLNS